MQIDRGGESARASERGRERERKRGRERRERARGGRLRPRARETDVGHSGVVGRDTT